GGLEFLVTNPAAVVGLAVAIEVHPGGARVVAPIDDAGGEGGAEAGAGREGAGDAAGFEVLVADPAAIVGLAVAVEVHPADARVVAPVDDVGGGGGAEA